MHSLIHLEWSHDIFNIKTSKNKLQKYGKRKHCTELIGIRKGGFIIMFILRANYIITCNNKKKEHKMVEKIQMID